jgi:hypothetical protein
VCERTTVSMIDDFQRREKAIAHKQQYINASAACFDRDRFASNSADNWVPDNHFYCAAPAIAVPHNTNATHLLPELITPRKICGEQEFNHCSFVWFEFARLGKVSHIPNRVFAPISHR